MSRMLPRFTALLVVVTLGVGLTACTKTEGTGGVEYITADGQVSQIPADKRGEPIVFDGEGLDGSQLSLEQSRADGKLTVVNVWWSNCPPCQKEQPELNEVAQQTADISNWIGLNIRDLSPTSSQGYVRKFDVHYPSFFDPDGEAIDAFHGLLGPRTVPATVVLDSEGRIAASIIGSIPSAITLKNLIQDVADGADQSGTNG